MNKSDPIIHWFRRDLRLSDNCSFYEATQASKNVIPLFIFDSNILDKLKNKEDKRIQFIMDGVLELKKRLKKTHSTLLILYGNPIKLVPSLAKKLKAHAVYCNEDYEPYAKTRDSKVKKQLEKISIEFHSFKDHVIFSGHEILKEDGTPYRVFTPYKNKWLKELNSKQLKHYKFKSQNLAPTNMIPHSKIKQFKDIGFKPSSTIKGGESEASKKFKAFLKKIKNYKKGRDYISLNATSSLSPFIRFGMISTRELVRQTFSIKNKGASTWLSEIIWKEFYQMILVQFPHVTQSSFNPKYKFIRWPGSNIHFNKWKQGKTGFPLIDAAMIHFANTGIMHNRLRMIVASFLVKDLLVDWKKGEKYFSEKLLDYDLASNNGGWQWCASTGCDAQPYFRVFNPVSQSKKFDPDGTFIKTHLPILKNYSSKEVHFPANCSLSRQIEVGCVIGKDYPLPIIDHDIQRKKAIELFKQV